MPATRVTSYETTDWTDLSTAPNTVTANGNRSYSLVFNSTDYTGLIQPGTRIRTTRTVAAPTQCTSLNGTNQYFNKTSPAGMTFTNNFVVSAWVKLSSYANSIIASRYNGTSGWYLRVDSSGFVELTGLNGGAANYSYVRTYQSIPLNKWVHVAAQLDMATFTATPTTSYVMLDGVDVPCSVGRAGTNPTALIQAGNLEIGSLNGGVNPFPGKLAQVAIFNAKVTQATIQGYISQGLSGTETSLISAYSFNNSINDLNTTNANNLTANGSAVATNADSPFGGNSFGNISSTLDYGIVQSSTFSTNTTLVVQVPEGCTIPTSGGVTTVSYSALKAPYGMPSQRVKWTVETLGRVIASQGSPTNGTWYYLGNLTNKVPVGEWYLSLALFAQHDRTSGVSSVYGSLSTSTSSESNTRFTGSHQTSATGASNTAGFGRIYNSDYVSLPSATNYYVIMKTQDSSTNIYNRGDQAATVISAENAYL